MATSAASVVIRSWRTSSAVSSQRATPSMKARVPVPPARPVVSVSKNSTRRGSNARMRSNAPSSIGGIGSIGRRAVTSRRPGAISSPGKCRSSVRATGTAWRASRSRRMRRRSAMFVAERIAGSAGRSARAGVRAPACRVSRCSCASVALMPRRVPRGPAGHGLSATPPAACLPAAPGQRRRGSLRGTRSRGSVRWHCR